MRVVKQGLIAETDLLKKLNHPNLPSIIDVIDGDGTFLIVMDYIEGKSLNSILQDAGRPEAGRCSRVGKTALRCSGISSFQETPYHLSGYETRECYAETGWKGYAD